MNLRCDWFLDSFKITPLMSSYLVAFVVSNLKTITKNSPRKNIPIEILARSEAIDNKEISFALNESLALIDYFIDYFQIPFDLPKLGDYFLS